MPCGDISKADGARFRVHVRRATQGQLRARSFEGACAVGFGAVQFLPDREDADYDSGEKRESIQPPMVPA